jgi:hypothetical protein
VPIDIGAVRAARVTLATRFDRDAIRRSRISAALRAQFMARQRDL